MVTEDKEIVLCPMTLSRACLGMLDTLDTDGNRGGIPPRIGPRARLRRIKIKWVNRVCK